MTTGVNLAARQTVPWLWAWLAFVPCCCSAVGPLLSSGAHAAAPSAQCHVLVIEGMTCKECAAHVQKALAKVPGVAEANVNYDKGEAKVCSKPGADVKTDTLIEAVKKAGYRAKVKRQP